MEAKKILSSVVILAIAGLGVWAFLNYRNSIPAKVGQLQTQNSEVAIEDKKITEESAPLKINITYPAISGMDAFNQKVEGIIQEELNSFKEISLENDEAVKKLDPKGYTQFPREYMLTIGYTAGEVDENMVSVVLNIENYTGGAHGASYFRSITWDAKNNREVALSELFPGQTNYLQNISTFTSAEIRKQMIERTGSVEGAWIEDGAGPKEENFSVFLVNKDSITFYFPPYQVAAYAFGDFRVTMPR